MHFPIWKIKSGRAKYAHNDKILIAIYAEIVTPSQFLHELGVQFCPEPSAQQGPGIDPYRLSGVPFTSGQASTPL